MNTETRNIHNKILFCWNNGIHVKPFGSDPERMRLVILRNGKKAKLINGFYTIQTLGDRIKTAYEKIYEKINKK